MSTSNYPPTHLSTHPPTRTDPHAHAHATHIHVCDSREERILRFALLYTQLSKATQHHPLHNTVCHCKPLQTTTICCNPLYNTASHCNTLQATATHCSPLRPTAAHCDPLQPTTPEAIQHCQHVTFLSASLVSVISR